MDKVWLDMAVDAAQKNDQARAYELLRGYVCTHRKDEQGWLWLSRVAESPSEKTDCLQRVLQINQKNMDALRESGRNGNGKNGIVYDRNKMEQAVTTYSVQRSNTKTQRKETRNMGAVERPPHSQAPTPINWARRAVSAAIFLVSAILFLVVGIAILPMFFGNRSLVILSGSMEPVIQKGSVAVVAPVASKNLQVGDIIAFNPTAESQIPIVHRIVKIEMRNGTRYFTTRGDANKSADPTEISLPATAWRETFTVPLVGYIISYATSTVGTILLIIVPMVSLAFFTAADWLRKKNRAAVGQFAKLPYS